MIKSKIIAFVIMVYCVVWAKQLTVEAHFTVDDPGPETPLQITFSEPMIPFGFPRDSVPDGLSLSPSISGRWSWYSQSILQFEPDDRWSDVYQYHLTVPATISSKISGHHLKQPFTKVFSYGLFYGSFTLKDTLLLPTDSVIISFTIPVHLDSLRNHLAGFKPLEITAINKTLFYIKAQNGWPSGKMISLNIDSCLPPLEGDLPLISSVSTHFVAGDSLICLGLFRNGSPVSAEDSLFLEDRYTIRFNREPCRKILSDYINVNGKPYNDWIYNNIDINLFLHSSKTCTLEFKAGMPSNDSAYLFNDVRFVLNGAYNRIDPTMQPFSINDVIVKYAPCDSLPDVKLSEKMPFTITPSIKFEFPVNVKMSSNERKQGVIVLYAPDGIVKVLSGEDTMLQVYPEDLPSNAPCTLVVKAGYRFGKYQLKNDYIAHFTTGKKKVQRTYRTVIDNWGDNNRFCYFAEHWDNPQFTLLPEKPAVPLEVFGKQKIITAIRKFPVSEGLLSYDSTRFLPHVWHFDTIADLQTSDEVYTYIPVPLTSVLSDQGRGAAEVLVSADGSPFDTVGLYSVTDLGVRTFYGKLMTAASVSSLTRRTPVSGATVSFINRKLKVVASGKTDSSGVFKVPRLSDVIFALVAFERDTLLWESPYIGYFCDTIMNKGIVFTERTFYRPGDTLYFKGILRKISDRWAPAQTDSVIISIPWEGAQVFSDTIPVVGLGSFSGKIAIPFQVKLKEYSLTASPVHAEYSFAQSSFSVKEFRTSELKGTVGEGRIEADSVIYPISAKWLHEGAAQKSAVSVNWVVNRYNYTGSGDYVSNRSKSHGFSFKDSVTTILDSNGTGYLSLRRLPDDSGAHYYITATIAGSPIHSVKVSNSVSIPVSNRPCVEYLHKPAENDSKDTMIVRTKLENGSVAIKERVDISIIREDVKKRKVKNRLGLPAFALDTIRAIVMTRSITTDTAGIRSICLSSLRPGKYTISSVTPAFDSSDTFFCDFTIYEPSIELSNTNSEEDESEFELSDVSSEEDESSSEKGVSLKIINPCTYAVGDTVQVRLHADRNSCVAAIAVRRENLYESRWIRMAGRDTIITIVVKDEYIPKVCIEADFLLPLYRNSNGLTFNQPLGLKYVYTTIDISDSPRVIPVTVSTDSNEFSPGDSVTVSVSVPSKFASATALVMVVDEGVLNVDYTDHLYIAHSFKDLNDTDFINYYNDYSFQCFHGPFNYDSCNALKLKSGIGYGPGFGSGFGEEGYSGGIDNLIGYTEESFFNIINNTMRDPIRICACFNPDVKFDSNGKATCRFKLPGNLSRWRVTAIVDDTTSFGVDTTSFAANLPLMIRPQLPRFLRAGDSASAQYILENSSKDSMVIKSGTFTSGDTALDSCTLHSNSARFCNFPLIGRACGTDSLLFLAQGGSFSDGIKVGIPVIEENTRMVQAIGGSTNDNVQIPLYLPEKTTVSNCSLAVVLSTTRMQNLQEGVRYLFDYPYGCLEQQGSRILPILCMKSFTEQFNILMLKNGDEKIVIQKYLDNIGTFQNSLDGGLTYWPSDSGHSYPWLTAYSLEIMCKAKKLGYSVIDTVYNKMINYVKNEIKNDTNEELKNLVIKSYIVLVLTQAGETNWQALKDLYQIRNRLPLTARIDLLKAIYASGKNKRWVKVLQSNLRNRLIEKDRLAYFAPEESKGLEFCHESPVRQTALCLEALLETGAKSRFDEPMIQWLTDQRKSGRWRTTQENMAVFRAFAAYTNVYEQEEPVLTAAVKLARDLWFTTDLQGREGVKAYRSRPLDSIPLQGETAISIDRSGSGRLYYDLLLSSSVSSTTPAYSSGLAIKRTITPVTKTTLGSSDTSQLQIGKCVQVELNIRCDQDITFVAIEDPIPAGCEVIDPEVVSGEQELSLKISRCSGPQYPQYHEFRDSRVLYFYNDMPAGNYKIRYLLKPTTSGKFLWPAPKAEAMYYPEISGRGTARMVRVR
jgi:hypothetical protein